MGVRAGSSVAGAEPKRGAPFRHRLWVSNQPLAAGFAVDCGRELARKARFGLVLRPVERWFEPEDAPSTPLAACGFGERPSKINVLCSRL